MKTSWLFLLGMFSSCATPPMDPAKGLFDRLDADGSGDLVQEELASQQSARILQGMDTDGAFQVVKAHVPQMDLYKYSTNLRSLTEGRGLHTEALSHYENMPREMEQKVIASNQSNGEE